MAGWPWFVLLGVAGVGVSAWHSVGLAVRYDYGRDVTVAASTWAWV